MKAILILVIIIAMSSISAINPIIDSNMSFEEAIAGTNAPKELIAELVLLDLMYYSFDKKLHKGQLVVHQDVKDDVEKIFGIILNERFPIKMCIPIVKYKWSDNASMAANNTSAFNYRNIANTNRLSKHSYGKAIDFNPVENPAVYSDGSISPAGAKYNPKKRGTLKSDSPIVLEFKRLGWRWGGEFNSFKDYQHFDKD